jgi:tRNA dimethylallyltransferase
MVSGPIVAIVGPTASGKSSLAMAVARKYDGEIIAADSRTIYRGMDIGTAKPTSADRTEVPHHLLDVIDPNQSYSAAEFKAAAEREVEAIQARGNLPIVVGGTGLYVYGLLYDYQFPAGGANELRDELQRLPLGELVERLQRQDPEAAATIDLQNPRRVVRALETVGHPRHKAMRLKSDMLLVGLRPSEDQLNKQIVQRTHTFQQIGLASEVAELVKKYGPETEAFRSPGYAEIIDYLADLTTLEEAEALINLHTRQLTRRQLTWFKRNPEIQWFETQAEAEAAIDHFVDNGYT